MKHTTKSPISNRLAEIRKRNRLSLEQVSILLGDLTTERLEQFERGAKTPNLKTALKLAHIFNLPVRVMLDGYFDACRAEIKREGLRRTSTSHGKEGFAIAAYAIDFCTFEANLAAGPAGDRGYADRVLRRAARARRHAHAMKQLSDRFSIADLQSLNADKRAKWLGLLKGHADKFLNETAVLERELQTVFPDLGGGSAAGGVGSDKELQTTVRRLYELAVNADEDLRGSFAVFTNASSAAEVKTAKFWRTFNSAIATARAIQSAR